MELLSVHSCCHLHFQKQFNILLLTFTGHLKCMKKRSVHLLSRYLIWTDSVNKLPSTWPCILSWWLLPFKHNYKYDIWTFKMDQMIWNKSEYSQVWFMPELCSWNILRKSKSHKSNTKFPFKTVYFLRARGLTASPCVVHDYTTRGHTNL